MNFFKKLFFVVALGLLTALPAQAALLPACVTDVNAVLQLSCFLQLLVSVSQWILGITGSLALLFFVYGGFMFLTSRGNTEQVSKGKTILTQATIGIIIIFGAYIAVNFLVGTVLKAKFTTEIPKEAATTAPKAPAAPTTQTKPICVCAVIISSEMMASGMGTVGIIINKACSAAGGKLGSSQTVGATAFVCSIPSVTDAAACSKFQSPFATFGQANCSIGSTLK